MSPIDIEGLALEALGDASLWDETAQEALSVPYYMGSYRLRVSADDERVFETYYHPEATGILLQEARFLEQDSDRPPVLWVSLETLEHNAQLARDKGIESVGAWNLFEVSFNNRRMALAGLNKGSK